MNHRKFKQILSEFSVNFSSAFAFAAIAIFFASDGMLTDKIVLFLEYLFLAIAFWLLAYKIRV